MVRYCTSTTVLDANPGRLESRDLFLPQATRCPRLPSQRYQKVYTLHEKNNLRPDGDGVFDDSARYIDDCDTDLAFLISEICSFYRQHAAAVQQSRPWRHLANDNITTSRQILCLFKLTHPMLFINRDSSFRPPTNSTFPTDCLTRLICCRFTCETLTLIRTDRERWTLGVINWPRHDCCYASS